MAQCLKFLVSGGREERAVKFLRQAATEATAAEIDVSWISVDDAKRNPDEIGKETVIVCESFEGDAFECLKSHGKRIVGAGCIIHCLRKMEPLPAVSYPILSLTMSDVVACCTNISLEQRAKLKEMIMAMGGIMIGDFTQSVTHLIAGEVGSKKYQVACSIGIPIMQQSWVSGCWSQSSLRIIESLDDLAQKHLCPCFKGLTICVTGFDAGIRHEVKKLAEENGGKYSGELNMRTCTHLIVKIAKGEKYNYARQWKIHCVSLQWFYDCLQKGNWIEEKNYEITPGDISTMDDSKILDIGKSRVNMTIQSDLECSVVSSKAAKVAEISMKNRENASKNLDVKADKFDGGPEKKTAVKIRAFDTSKLKLLDVKMKSSMLLDGCKIYLSEIPNDLCDQFRRLINTAGAMRFNLLNTSVTHIIIGDAVSSEVEKFLDENLQKPYVVSPDWLLDSCRMGTVMKEDAYSLIDHGDEETLMAKPAKVPSRKELKNSGSSTKKEPQNVPSFQLDDDLEEDVFFGQYLPQAESSRISFVAENKTPLAKEEKEKSERMERISDELQKVDSAEAIAGPKEELDQTTCDRTISNKTFEHCKFVVKFFDEETNEQVKSLIEEFNGKIVKQESRSDYVVVPLTFEKKRRIGKKEVTICWLEQSLETEVLLPSKSSFLFRPFHLPPDCFPLKDCVMTISQFNGIQREHLIQLGDLLGATMQDNFVRKQTNDLLANTHLLLAEATGPKYEAACKWGVTCVSKKWLFACAENRKLMFVEDFPLDEKEGVDEGKEGEAGGEAGGEAEEVLVEDNGEDDGEEKKGLDLKEGDGLEVEPANDQSETLTQVTDETVKELRSEDGLTRSDAGKTFATPVSKGKPMLKRGKPFKPSFDLGDMMEYLKSPASCFTPGTKRRASRSSFAFDEFVGSQLRKALEITGSKKSGEPEASDVTEQKCEEHSVSEESKGSDNAIAGKDSDEKMIMKQLKGGEEHLDAGILKGVVVIVSKKLAGRQAEIHNLAKLLGADYRYAYDDSCTHLIHKGKITDHLAEVKQARSQGKFIVSEHWLDACSDNNARVQEDLYPCSYNPKMSLSVVSKGKKSTRASRSNTSRQNTEDIIETRNSPIARDNDKSNQRSVDDSKCLPNPSSNDEPKESPKGNTGKMVSPPAIENTSSLDARLQFKRQMEEIMQATKGNKGGLLRNRRQILNSASPNDDSSFKRSSVAKRLRTRQSSQRSNSESSKSSGEKKPNSKVANFPSLQPSQGDVITYDDPAGRLERERILAQLKAASPSQDGFQEFRSTELSDLPVDQLEEIDQHEEAQSSVANVGNHQYHCNLDHLTTPPKRPVNMHISNPVLPPNPVSLLEEDDKDEGQAENKQIYKFILSAMTQQEKIHYSAMIEELGGMICDSQYFTLECSHVIVGTPNRNEKFLASVAAGKWVLHKSFLEASREMGGFVAEEDHEWGTEAEPSKLTLAVKRWRERLDEERKVNPTAGAFKGWHVLLCVGSSVKQHGFKRMLEAGSGTVGSTHPPFNNLERVTHAFVDPSKVKPGLVDYSGLYAAGIWVLRPDYIVDYLTIDPPPPTLKYVIPEVQKLMESAAKISNSNEPKKRKKLDETSSQKMKRSRK